MSKVKAAITYQWGKCSGNIVKSQYSIRCAGECEKWFHKKCTGLTNDQFLVYEKRTCDEKWMCSKCIDTKEDCSMKNPSNTS
nr:unnamed protein product [Callosobruchus analis]